MGKILIRRGAVPAAGRAAGGAGGCRYCGKPVSPRAKNCPACGHPTPRHSAWLAIAIIVMVIGMALTVVAAWLESRGPVKPPPRRAVSAW